MHLHADSLQRLHTLANLHELLQGPAKDLPDVPKTLRDDNLPEQAQQLRYGSLFFFNVAFYLLREVFINQELIF